MLKVNQKVQCCVGLFILSLVIRATNLMPRLAVLFVLLCSPRASILSSSQSRQESSRNYLLSLLHDYHPTSADAVKPSGILWSDKWATMSRGHIRSYNNFLFATLFFLSLLLFILFLSFHEFVVIRFKKKECLQQQYLGCHNIASRLP